MTPATVFIVDDAAAVRDGLSLLCEARGLLVESYDCAEAFLEVYRPALRGCLVLDVRMGRMSGPELHVELTRRGSLLPILYLTGHGDIPLSVQAMKAGAVNFLTKPVNSEVLLAGIAEAFQESERLHREAEAEHLAAERFARLSERERALLVLTIGGLRNKEIGHRLGISNRTVADRKIGTNILSFKQQEAETIESNQPLHELSSHLDRVREEERKHLAREIHDDLGQRLAALRFDVATLGKEMNPPTKLADKTAALLKQIDDTIDAARIIATDLRPAVLDLGLMSAIEWQVQEFSRRTGILCTLKLNCEDFEFDDVRTTAVYRIVQESLTNILRHADASKVQLTMSKHGDKLQIQIEDNGVGLSSEALEKPHSFGVAGMRERVLLLDGDLEISSHPGGGTRLKVSIPLLVAR